MRKKIVWLVALLILSVGAACAAQADADGVKVVTTIFPLYDFAREIAGADADIQMLVKPGVESHAFEPTPMDIVAIEAADVFLYIGGENDAWVDRLTGSLDLSGKQVVRLIDCVDTIAEEDEDHAHEQEEDHDGIDEHIWTSPANAAKMASTIEAALAAAHPANADAYAQNGALFADALASLDADFQAVIRGAVRTELVFGDRFPFRYFAQHYGLTCYAAFPSCANDTEPSAQTVASLIERVNADAIPVIYTIEQSNGRVARVIEEATGARPVQLHSCHNVTKDELNGGASYLSLMRENLEALKLGLE